MKKVIALALAMIMVFSLAACESAPAEKAPAETPVENNSVEAVDEAKIVEAVKAANGKVSDVAFADADADMCITVTMAADATEEDVNAALEALKAEVEAEAFIATNFFHNTDESVNKTFTVNFVLGEGSDVAYTAGSIYSAGKGRKGVLYTRTKAWTAPEAPAAE